MTDHKDKLLVPDNKEDLIPFTKKLKKVYGDKSKSITWLRKNGYSSLINRARKYYGKWSLFTLQADFLSENKSVHNQWTVKSISDTFDKLVDLHGEQKVNNTVWLRENGYGGMVKAIREIYGSFSEFQKDFGLRKTYTVNKWHKDMMIPYLNQLFEKHGKNGLSSHWLCQNGYSGFVDAVPREYGTWSAFKEIAGFETARTYKDWKKEELTPYLKATVNEHGNDALSSNWFNSRGLGHFVNAVRFHFEGSWPLFVEASGFKTNVWKKEDMIPHLHKLVKKYGDNGLNCQWLIDSKGGHSGFIKASRKHYGKWTTFKKEAGFSNKKNAPGTFAKLSKEDLKRYIQELKEQKNIDQNAFNSSWLKKNGHGGVLQQALNLYGKWNTFLNEFDPKPYHLRSKEELLKEFEDLYEIHGEKLLTTRGLQDVDASLHHFIKKKFKTWGIFRSIVDKNPPTRRGKYRSFSKEDCLKEFNEIYTEHGEEALRSKFLNAKYSGLKKVISELFNNWQDFLISAGFEPDFEANKDWTNIDFISYIKELIAKEGQKAVKRSWLSKNKHSGFIKAVCREYGSWENFRETIGYPSAIAQIKKIKIENYKKIKLILSDLKEHVRALEPRDIYILLQQHNLLDLPKEQGGFLVKKLLGGDLPYEAIEDWLDSNDELPNEEKNTGINQKDSESQNQNTKENQSREDTENNNDSDYENNDETPSDESLGLPDLDAIDALNLLNSNAWATDDVEAAESLISSCLDKVWNHAYRNESEALDQVKEYKGNKWCDVIKNKFLNIYHDAVNIKIPKNYIFPHQPRLMQRVAAVEAMKRSRLLILSGMGLGKTLASTLATQVSGSKVVWVICPNNTIKGWEKQLREQWRDIEIFKKEFNPESKSEKTKYLLLNFEKFSILQDHQIASLISNKCPDAIIIDEVQFAKQRTKEFISQRRSQISKCISLAGEINSKLLVLGMSGTPILNNLMEGRKLIELIFSEERNDLKVEKSFHNAMRMFQEFARLGIRQRNKDIWPTELITHQIDVSHLIEDLKQIRSSSKRTMSQYERLLIRPKIPYIVEICKNQPTLVVTEFTTGIVDPIRKALEKEGLKVGIYTGLNKLPTFSGCEDSLEEFKQGLTDVLIGSGDCMGTGVDGLQDVCSQMVYATLPWTEGDNAQIQARLARERQLDEVLVHVPQTFLFYKTEKDESKRWSFCEYRWSVIESKKALASAAVDGNSPSSDKRLTPQKALNYIDGWIDRLQKDEIIYRYGRLIKVPLEISDENQEISIRRKFGDFNKTNARWNNTVSHKTHSRLKVDPQEWELYQTDLLEKRKSWQVDPLKEVIKFCQERRGSIFGDFGCGTADLAKKVGKESLVYSFDHISINSSVIECDIGAGVPLEDDSLDFVIFSLSLMGTNWRDYLREARRCLKPNSGQIVIWNPFDQSINKNIVEFLEEIGFKVIINEQRWKWLHIWCIALPKI